MLYALKEDRYEIYSSNSPSQTVAVKALLAKRHPEHVYTLAPDICEDYCCPILEVTPGHWCCQCEPED